MLFIKPQPLFHAIAAKLAGNQKIGILVPEPDQVEQAYHTWGKSGIPVEVTSASPYLDFDKVVEAASFFKGKNLAFICTDCMGFTMEMKHQIQEVTGLPVLLPRTLVVRILCEMFS